MNDEGRSDDHKSASVITDARPPSHVTARTSQARVVRSRPCGTRPVRARTPSAVGCLPPVWTARFPRILAPTRPAAPATGPPRLRPHGAGGSAPFRLPAEGPGADPHRPALGPGCPDGGSRRRRTPVRGGARPRRRPGTCRRRDRRARRVARYLGLPVPGPRPGAERPAACRAVRLPPHRGKADRRRGTRRKGEATHEEIRTVRAFAALLVAVGSFGAVRAASPRTSRRSSPA